MLVSVHLEYSGTAVLMLELTLNTCKAVQCKLCVYTVL